MLGCVVVGVVVRPPQCRAGRALPARPSLARLTIDQPDQTTNSGAFILPARVSTEHKQLRQKLFQGIESTAHLPTSLGLECITLTLLENEYLHL